VAKRDGKEITQLNALKAIIEKCRITCQFYLKIDFGLLVGIATIATILKLERLEVLTTIYQGRFFVLGVIILICYGLIFDRWLLTQWSEQELTDNEKRTVLKWSRRGITTQLLLHLLLVLSLSTYLIAYTGVYPRGYDEGKAITSIHIAIEKFKNEKGVFPKTLENLISQYPYVSRYVRKLGNDKLRYIVDENRGYVLWFAGFDEQLDTEDDFVHDRKSFTDNFGM